MIATPPAHTATGPRRVVAGLGCRRGCAQDELLALLQHSLTQQQLTVDNLAGLASVAHKREEAGLLALAAALGLPVHFYTPEQLAPYQAQSSASALTQSATGSPAVAEPCALALAAQLGARRSALLGSKTRSASATCALASVTEDYPA